MINHRSLPLLGILFTLACAEAVPVTEVEILPKEKSCKAAFNPDPNLLEATKVHAMRWAIASNCHIAIETNGIPIVVLDEVIGNGKSVRGTTRTTWIDGMLYAYQIEIRSDSLDQLDRIIPHELGHALGGFGHTLTGVMQENPDAWDPIDTASLELVCMRLNCTTFIPEL